MSATAFTDIEARAVSLLQGDTADYFDDISILVASKGSVMQNVNQRLGLIDPTKNQDGKVGLCVLVAVRGASALPLSGSAAKARVGAAVVCAVLENPAINNTNGPKRAIDVAGQVVRVMNGQPINASVSRASAVQRFIMAEPAIQQIQSEADQVTLYGVTGATVYHVNWQVQVNL